MTFSLLILWDGFRFLGIMLKLLHLLLQQQRILLLPTPWTLGRELAITHETAIEPNKKRIHLTINLKSNFTADSLLETENSAFASIFTTGLSWSYYLLFCFFKRVLIWSCSLLARRRLLWFEQDEYTANLLLKLTRMNGGSPELGT